MTDAFISYSRKDRVFVQRLLDALSADNREVWVDWEGIPLTADWWAEIQEGIEAADSFVFIISPDAATSKVCNQEVEHAARHNKRIVPIVYRDVPPKELPVPLTQLNWVFCRDSDDFDSAFKALMEIMDTDLDWVKSHTRLTQRAVEWDKRSRSDSYVLRGEDLTAAEQMQIRTEKSPKLTELQAEYILASRKSASRRQRFILGAVTIGLVVAIVLGAIAFINFQTAQSEANARGTAEAIAVANEELALTNEQTAIAERDRAEEAEGTAVANEERAVASEQTAVAERDRAEAERKEAEKQR